MTGSASTTMGAPVGAGVIRLVLLSWLLVGCSHAAERDEPDSGPQSREPTGDADAEAPAPPPPPPPPTAADDAGTAPPDPPDPAPPPPPPTPVDPPPPPAPSGRVQTITERDEIVEQAAVALASDGYVAAWRSVERDPGGDVVRVRFARLDRAGARIGDSVVLAERAVGAELLEGPYLAERSLAWDGAQAAVAFTERNRVDLGERITTFVRVSRDGAILGEPHRVSRPFHRGVWLDASDGGFTLTVARDFDSTLTRIASDGTLGAPAIVALDPAETVQAVASSNGTELALLVHRSTRNPDELSWLHRVALDGTSVATPVNLALEAYRAGQSLVATTEGHALLWHGATEDDPRRVDVRLARVHARDVVTVEEPAVVARSTAWYRTVHSVSGSGRGVANVAWMSSADGGYTGTPMFRRVYPDGSATEPCALQDVPATPDFDVFALAVACDPTGIACVAVWGEPADGASGERPIVSLRARVIASSACR